MATLRKPVPGAPQPSLRDKFNRWFVTHEVAWELAMAALAVLYVALGFVVDNCRPVRARRSRRPSSS